MSIQIGYARVSKTEEQNLDLQLDALNKEGCYSIYQEKISGVKELPEQQQAIKSLRAGDTLTVWKIDRLGRSTLDLLKLLEWLNVNNIGFKSITEGIDTTTINGKLFFTITAAFAENERSKLVERTKAGLEAARTRGRVGGRKRALTDKQTKQAEAMLDIMKVSEVCEKFNISKSTLYLSISRLKND